MDEKHKLWLEAGLKALPWAYLALSAIALVTAVAGRFAVRVPEHGFGIMDLALLLLSLAVVLGGFWLLRVIAERLTSAK